MAKDWKKQGKEALKKMTAPRPKATAKAKRQMKRAEQSKGAAGTPRKPKAVRKVERKY